MFISSVPIVNSGVADWEIDRIPEYADDEIRTALDKAPL